MTEHVHKPRAQSPTCVLSSIDFLLSGLTSLKPSIQGRQRDGFSTTVTKKFLRWDSRFCNILVPQSCFFFFFFFTIVPPTLPEGIWNLHHQYQNTVSWASKDADPWPGAEDTEGWKGLILTSIHIPLGTEMTGFPACPHFYQRSLCCSFSPASQPFNHFYLPPLEFLQSPL